VRIRASDLNRISFPPGEISAELERAQAGEDVMVKPAAEPSGVVAADIEGFAHSMRRSAFAFDARNGRSDTISDSRIMSHNNSLLLRFTVYGSRLEQNEK
jgi:hypothetical protein